MVETRELEGRGAGNAHKHSASHSPPQRQELWWLTSRDPDVCQNSQGKEAQAGDGEHTVGG